MTHTSYSAFGELIDGKIDITLSGKGHKSGSDPLTLHGWELKPFRLKFCQRSTTGLWRVRRPFKRRV